MGRRRTGWIVLLLAILVAVVIPNLTPQYIAGTATGTPPAPPPAVGDCIVQPFDVFSSITTPVEQTRTDASQVCMVNGEHRSFLDGSLLALGAQPVPFG